MLSHDSEPRERGSLEAEPVANIVEADGVAELVNAFRFTRGSHAPIRISSDKSIQADASASDKSPVSFFDFSGSGVGLPHPISRFSGLRHRLQDAIFRAS